MRVLIVAEQSRDLAKAGPLLSTLSAHRHRITVMSSREAPDRLPAGVSAEWATLPRRFTYPASVLLAWLQSWSVWLTLLHPRFRGWRLAPLGKPRFFGVSSRLLEWSKNLVLLGRGAPLAVRAGLRAVARLVPPELEIVRHLRQSRADVVVLLEPGTGIWAAHVSAAARLLGVPLTALPVTQGALTAPRMPVPAVDAFLAWGDDHRNDAVDVHRVPARNVFVVGAVPFSDCLRPVPPVDTVCQLAGISTTGPFFLFRVLPGADVTTVRRCLEACHRTRPSVPVVVWTPSAAHTARYGALYARTRGVTVWPHGPVATRITDFTALAAHAAGIAYVGQGLVIEPLMLGRPVLMVETSFRPKLKVGGRRVPPIWYGLARESAHRVMSRLSQRYGAVQVVANPEALGLQLSDGLDHPPDLGRMPACRRDQFVQRDGAPAELAVRVLERLAAEVRRPRSLSRLSIPARLAGVFSSYCESMRRTPAYSGRLAGRSGHMRVDEAVRHHVAELRSELGKREVIVAARLKDRARRQAKVPTSRDVRGSRPYQRQREAVRKALRRRSRDAGHAINRAARQLPRAWRHARARAGGLLRRAGVRRRG